MAAKKKQTPAAEDSAPTVPAAEQPVPACPAEAAPGEVPAAEAELLEVIDAALEGVEAEPFDLVEPSVTPREEPQEELRPVFDDAFIRARRARNAAKGVPSLLNRSFDDALGADTPDIPSAVPDDGLSEEILSSHPVWRGSFLRVDDVSVRLPNGRIAQRDVVRHPGAVAVIALTAEGKLVLVHQYRTSLEQVTLEIPAGKLDPGEDPAHAAARELLEETGYMAARMAYLGPIAVAAGYSDEIIHLYMAMGLSFAGARPDDDEFVHVDLVDLDEMVDRVLDGKVIDSKTVVGVLLCDAISRRMDA